MSNGAEPEDLDPGVLFATTDANIANSLFEGLTQLDEATALPQPAAAERWEASPDGLTYTFHLRMGARWSDGVPVTAGDFIYGMRRVLSPAFASGYSYMLWPIHNAQAFNEGRLKDFSQVGLRAPDPLTLVVSVDRPTPYLPGLAAHQTWWAVPRQTVEKFGRMDQKGTRWTRAGNLVGNGAFVLKEWVQNSRIAVEKNPLYWNAGHVRLRRIVFYPIENEDSEELALRSGRVAVTYGFPIAKLDPYRREHPDELAIEHQLLSYYLFFNVSRPPFDNPKLRLALSTCIDRESICRQVLHGAQSPAGSMTPPDMVGYTCQARIKGDFGAARRLLTEAGYPGGRGLGRIEVLCYQTNIAIRTLEAVQEQWARELGVHVTALPQEQKTLFQNQQSGNYSIAYSGWGADYADPYSFLGTMVTGSGNNWAKWSNPEFDRLVDASTRTGDNAVRFPLFQRAEAILIRDAPLAPLYYGERPYGLKPWVKGYPLSRLGFHRWQNVYLER